MEGDKLIYIFTFVLFLIFIFSVNRLIFNIKSKKVGWSVLWIIVILILIGMVITAFGTSVVILN